MDNRNSFYKQRIGGIVYILRDSDGNLKVGASNYLRRRIINLRNKYEDELVLVATIYAVRYMQLEQFLHYDLVEYQIKREWFFHKDENVIINRIRLFFSLHGSIFGSDGIEMQNKPYPLD